MIRMNLKMGLIYSENKFKKMENFIRELKSKEK